MFKRALNWFRSCGGCAQQLKITNTVWNIRPLISNITYNNYCNWGRRGGLEDTIRPVRTHSKSRSNGFLAMDEPAMASVDPRAPERRKCVCNSAFCVDRHVDKGGHNPGAREKKIVRARFGCNTNAHVCVFCYYCYIEGECQKNAGKKTSQCGACHSYHNREKAKLEGMRIKSESTSTEPATDPATAPAAPSSFRRDGLADAHGCAIK